MVNSTDAGINLTGTLPPFNAFVTRNLATCPIRLGEALANNKAQHIFVAGQNLYTFATSAKMKADIRTFLVRDNTKLHVLMCDPNYAVGVEAWSKVNHESGDYEYRRHLLDATRDLLTLQREAPPGRMEVRVAPLVPFSGWFLDPESPNATMVMTIIVPNSWETEDRPQLVVKRNEHLDIFEFCWSRLRTIFKPAGLSKSLSSPRIFISHGHSPAWRDLKDFLHDRLKLTEPEEFNRESPASMTPAERLAQMLDNGSFAFIVMTAEDEQVDGTYRARENVVHEAGMTQARYGRKRAIILLEEGCQEFSNIVGDTQIRFPKGNLQAKFEEIRQVLEREKII